MNPFQSNALSHLLSHPAIHGPIILDCLNHLLPASKASRRCLCRLHHSGSSLRRRNHLDCTGCFISKTHSKLGQHSRRLRRGAFSRSICATNLVYLPSGRCQELVGRDDAHTSARRISVRILFVVEGRLGWLEHLARLLHHGYTASCPFVSGCWLLDRRASNGCERIRRRVSDGL